MKKTNYKPNIGTSSFSICSLIIGLIVSYSPRSTFLPRIFSSSNFNLIKSSKLIRPSISTKISISLFFFAAPLAAEPKIPALLTLYFLSIGRIALLISSQSLAFTCIYPPHDTNNKIIEGSYFITILTLPEFLVN